MASTWTRQGVQESDYADSDRQDPVVDHNIRDFRSNSVSSHDMKIATAERDDWKVQYENLLIDYDKICDDKKELQAQVQTLSAGYDEMKQTVADKESMIAHVEAILAENIRAAHDAISQVRCAVGYRIQA
jgi:hypothetical protein